MPKKSNKVDLPDWAIGLWNDLGSPSLDKLQGVHSGDLLERRNGLRRDDLIEILIDARALRRHLSEIKGVVSLQLDIVDVPASERWSRLVND